MNKRQSMNTWYKRTLTCTRSRLYQFNFKFKKAPCQTGVFYNTSMTLGVILFQKLDLEFFITDKASLQRVGVFFFR